MEDYLSQSDSLAYDLALVGIKPPFDLRKVQPACLASKESGVLLPTTKCDVLTWQRHDPWCGKITTKEVNSMRRALMDESQCEEYFVDRQRANDTHCIGPPPDLERGAAAAGCKKEQDRGQ